MLLCEALEVVNGLDSLVPVFLPTSIGKCLELFHHVTIERLCYGGVPLLECVLRPIKAC